LTLREPFARRLLFLLSLFELRVYPLVAFQPLPESRVARFGERQRPDLAQPDLAQRAVAGAVAIEEDLQPRSQTSAPAIRHTARRHAPRPPACTR